MGVHCEDTLRGKSFPDDLANAKELFDGNMARLEALKQSFRDELGALCRTLSPKESFELRLRYVAAMNKPHWFLGRVEREDKNGYVYTMFASGHFTVRDVDKKFIEDDDRYDVFFSCSRKDAVRYIMEIFYFPFDPAPHMKREDDEDEDEHDEDEGEQDEEE